MEGKTVVITGANSGIGFETARALALQGARLGLVCRSKEKGKNAAIALARETGNSDIHVVAADLSRQAEIREAGQILREKFARIDVLVNNAGIWTSEHERTPDGIETQFAVNHLAYFLLAHELLPRIMEAPEGRIVCVSSDSHFQVKKGMFWDDVNLTDKYHGLRAYAQSKLANVYFCYELHRLLRTNGLRDVHTYAVQPGLVKTDIGLKHTFSLHALAWKIRRNMGGKTPAEGAATSIYLASSEEASGQSGLYWDNCKPKRSSKVSYDEAAAARLWDLSCRLTGIEDYFSIAQNAAT